MNNYEYQRAHDQRLMASVSVAATVQVMKFDKSKMTVNVQPLSKHLQNGNYESQPPILGIPVAVTRMGGFILRPWIKEGDVGLVVYLDHDLDSTVSGGKEAEPQTTRNHSTSDAVFIGGIVSGGYTVAGLPDESLCLATEDGSVYVAVKKGGIEIKGDVSIDGKLSVSKDAQIDGGFSANNGANVKGSITATGDVISESGISGAHHTHTGCQGGSTGQPM